MSMQSLLISLPAALEDPPLLITLAATLLALLGMLGLGLLNLQKRRPARRAPEDAASWRERIFRALVAAFSRLDEQQVDLNQADPSRLAVLLVTAPLWKTQPEAPEHSTTAFIEALADGLRIRRVGPEARARILARARPLTADLCAPTKGRHR